MGLETRKKIAKMYREGKAWQNDLQAKAWADEFFPLVKEEKKEEKEKSKKSKD